jgi:murein DD-endopeptidase MepM/ murein hydrolase activator NlpD
LLLFFLAVAFPFFALLLVFPSRFMSFTMWFGLWFWVKSWDIGFALIMMLDDMLYGIFALSKQKGAVLDKEFINPALESTLRSLGELDPTFNLSTYHTIIGGCLAAVPVASSYLVLGAVKAGANLISQNIERYGSFLSDRVGRAAANAGGVGGPKRDALDDQGVLGEQLLSRAMGYDTGGGPVPPMSPQQNRTLSDTELAGAKDTGEGSGGGAGLGIGSGGGGGAPNRIGSTTDAGLQEALSRGLSVRSGGHAAISAPQLQAMAMNPASLKATNQFLNVGAGRTEGLNATQKALQEMYFDTGKKINEAEIAEQAGIAAKANADKLRFLQQSIRAIGRKSLPVLFNQSSGNYEERYSLGENLYSADTQSKIAPLKMELAKLGGDPFDVNNSFFYAGIREKEANDRRVPVTSAPVSNVRATSPFGQQREYSPGKKLPHLGVDLAANKGDSVGSLGDGLVVRAEKYLGYGNTVITYLGNGWFSLGAHFDRLAVSRGAEVRGGERIGFAGDSDTDAYGNAPSGAVRVTGPHVHQELIKAYWDPVKGHFDLMAHDPMPYIAAAGGSTVAPSSDPVPLRGMTGEFNRIIEEMRVSFPEKYAEIMSSPPASYFRINVPIAPPGGYGPEAHGEP